MKIMGIDPGLANTGWGLIESVSGHSAELVDCGCLSTSPEISFSERLNLLYKKSLELSEKFSPDEIAVEKLFFAKNTKTAMQVAHARGVIILAFHHSQKNIDEYTPLEIKQAVVGYGRADKNQVQFMVKNFLSLTQLPGPDHVSDALAAALCHLNCRKIKRILGKK